MHERIVQNQCKPLLMKINDRKFPIKCPNSECGVEVTDAEIREIVGDKAYEEYQEKAFKNYIDTNADTV